MVHFVPSPWPASAQSSPWLCEMEFVSCRHPIMKLHHSCTTPQAAKGKNRVLLYVFGPVTVATGEQADGNLPLADINRSFLPLILSPLTARELKLHPLPSTSERNKQAYSIYFYIYLQDIEENIGCIEEIIGCTYSLKSKTLYVSEKSHGM